MAARAFYLMSGFWQVLVHYLISILMTCQWTGGYVLCCKVEIITKMIVIVFLFVSSKFESSNKQCLSIKGCIIQCYIWCNMWLQKLLIYTVFLFFFKSFLDLPLWISFWPNIIAYTLCNKFSSKCFSRKSNFQKDIKADKRKYFSFIFFHQILGNSPSQKEVNYFSIFTHIIIEYLST